MEQQNTIQMFDFHAAGAKEKLARTLAILSCEWGRGVKHTEREQFALAFGKRFLNMGATFELTKEYRDFGYPTIWEAFAGEHHEHGLKPMDRARNAEDYATLYSTGCRELNKHLIDHWDDVVIYITPRRVDGSLIEVITIDPHFIVNIKGETARDIFQQREMKRSACQIQSSAKKLTRAVGPAHALAQLCKISANFNEMVKVPAGRRENRLT